MSKQKSSAQLPSGTPEWNEARDREEEERKAAEARAKRRAEEAANRAGKKISEDEAQQIAIAIEEGGQAVRQPTEPAADNPPEPVPPEAPAEATDKVRKPKRL